MESGQQQEDGQQLESRQEAEGRELNDLWYAHGEMRAIWKLGIYGATTFFLLFFAGMAIYVAVPGLDWRFATPLMTLAAAMVASVLCALAIDRRPLLDMIVLPVRAHARRQLGMGMLLSFVMMLALVGLELWFGEARMLSAHVTWGHSLSVLLLGLLSFILVGFAEEILARGYPFTVLQRQGGTATALLLTSGVFSLMHLFNPGIGWFGLLNIFLAGIWLGLARVTSGSLWLPIGMHIGWNFYLGPVFGFPVSGIIERSVLVTRSAAPDWIGGGSFGPEGGVLATLVLAAGTAVLFLPGLRVYIAPGARDGRNGAHGADVEEANATNAAEAAPGHTASVEENDNEVRQ